jgi:predicted unusual protein kinase regulating ubiquinone biosynthesis (AarF/ABC1/UbiB family)
MSDDSVRARRRAERKVGLARLWARAKQIVTTDPTGSPADDAVADDAAAAALAEEAGVLHGALAKVAQLAAYDPEALFGESLALERGGRARGAAALARLWDGAASVDFAAVEQVIIEELGQPPAKLFAAFDAEPLAAASIGQVHAARGHDGRDYVVKVQYPGVAAALAADLRDPALTRRLAGAHLGADLDADAIAALVATVRGEVDYQQEAAALRAFASIWADEPTLRFPEIDGARSSRRVLTMTRARGASLAALAQRQDERAVGVRAAAAAAIYRFTWGSPLAHAVLNTDPNPGNFLVEEVGDDTVVWCLDFGATTALEPAIVQADRQLWWALLAGAEVDAAERFRMALPAMGLLRRADSLASEVHRDWERALLEPFAAGPRFRFDGGYARRLAAATARALASGGLGLDARTLMLWRQRLAAAAVIGLLDAAVPCRQILIELIGSGRSALR